MLNFVLAALITALEPEVFQETLYPDWRQCFTKEKAVYEEKSDFWNLLIFENPIFGKVLSIDGTIQLTERDEYMYHEMMVHVPLFSHEKPVSVLVIGGGDGGVIREVMRHKSVERVVLVELDEQVMNITKKYIPSVPGSAFEDPRLEIIFSDAACYVKEADEKFDVIICDSTDPIGPAAMLFTSEFYGDCKTLLKEKGIFVIQSGAPFIQGEELQMTYRNRLPHFEHVTYYTFACPTYVGGLVALGWASDHLYRFSQEELEEKLSQMQGPLFYYTPEVHTAAFSLTRYIIDLMERKSSL